MAAAFPFTVSTTGRLLFLSCFMKSPERRRKVVSDWISLVMSSIGLLLLKHLFRCEQNTTHLCRRKRFHGVLRERRLVGAVGIEPTTFGLKGRCSTTELRP